MKLDKSKIKLYSSIGSRATFGLVSLELAKEINNLMILTSDVSTSAGLDRFKQKYPDDNNTLQPAIDHLNNAINDCEQAHD